MKKITFFLIVMILVTGLTYGQTYSTGNQTPSLEAIGSTSDASSTSATEINNNSVIANSGTIVFIDQLGDGNIANVRSTTEDGSIGIFQNGQGNKVALQISAGQIKQQIVQIGDNNNITDFGSSDRLRNLEIVQSGNNQNFILHGGNGISDRLKVSMKGQSQSIIVRNFN